MKNKILCLLLCAFLVVGGVLLSACNSGGYNLKNFSTDYAKIAFNEGVSVDNKGCLAFDFEQIETAIKAKEGELSESVETYYQPFITYHVPLTQNSLIFVAHVSEQLTAGKDVYRKKRNKIKDQLSSVENSAVYVQTKIKDFVGVINLTDATYKDARTTAMGEVEVALCKYYNSCRELSATVADVFFKDLLKNENKNYFASSVKYTTELMEALPDLAYYHISNLTQNFIEMNVDGEDVDFTAAFESYKDTTDTILSYAEKVSGKNLTHTDELYNNAVKLFTLNSKVINEREMYLDACNNIIYTQVLLDGVSDYNDSADMLIIEGYGKTLEEYSTVLLNILSGAN